MHPGVLAAMLAASIAVPPQAAAPALTPAWPTSEDEWGSFVVENIDIIPAHMVFTNADLVAVFEPETLTEADGRKRAWFRWEATSARRAEALNARSLRLHKEFDCAGGRSRVLAVAAYAGNNLSGAVAYQGENPDPAWNEDEPRTLNGAQAKAACRGEMALSDEQVIDIIREVVKDLPPAKK